MRYVHCIFLVAAGLLSSCGTSPMSWSQNPGVTPPHTGRAEVTTPRPPTVTPSFTAEDPESPRLPTPTTPVVARSTSMPPITPTPTITHDVPTAGPITARATPTTAQPSAPPAYVILSRSTGMRGIAADGSTWTIQVEGLDLNLVVTAPHSPWIAGPAALRDAHGQRLPGAEPALILYHLMSGERTVAPQAGPIDHLGFSPDSSVLVFNVRRENGATNNFYVLDLATGQQKLLPDLGTVQGSAFSPDSTALAFTAVDFKTSSWRLNVLELSTGRLRTLKAGTDSHGYVVSGWTSAGIEAYTYLVFGADGGPEGLYLIDPTDGTTRTRTPDGFTEALLSPDSRQLALDQGNVGVGIENPTFTLSLQDTASGATRLIEPEQPRGFMVGWSPDSTRLLYQSPGPSGDRPRYAITGPGIARPVELSVPSAVSQVNQIQWRDNDRLVLLVTEAERQILYELPLNGTKAGTPKIIAAFAASSKQETSRILYPSVP